MRLVFVLTVAFAAIMFMARDAASNDVFQMDGVAGFVEGRAREVIAGAISENGSKWMAEAIEKVFDRGRDKKTGKVDPKRVFYQDAETRRAVEAALKEKIKAWLPGAVKEIIVENVFGKVLSDETLKEAKEIAERVSKELDTSLNDRIDQTVGVWYDKTVETLRNKMAQSGVPGWVDVTDLKKTIDAAFDLGNISNMVAGQMGSVIGDATVTGIRGRITDALSGNLPPELVDALKRGPEEFDKYVKEAEKYLPGNQLSKLTNSILNKPLIKLPTPAYASMLAASAAGHFARAYDGVFVNPYEIKRGIEVTRVMIWQLQNKDFINLSIMQIASIARTVAAGFGAGAAFDGVMSKLKAPLDKLQGELDRLDAMIMKPIKDIQKEIKETVDRIQSELRDIQERLVAPVREKIDMVRDGLKEAGASIANQIPDEFNGLPASWEEVKRRTGLENGVFGEAGNKTPREMLKDAAKDLGLDEVGRKIKKDFSDVNDAIAGKIAKGAAGVLEAAHLLGPVAAILGVDKRPPKNESKSRELDPVLLHNGEFEQQVTDVVIPGRGVDFRFTRTYQSRGAFLGELGHGWTHSYAERLLPWNDGTGDGLTYIDESGRKYYFKFDGEKYAAPYGIYSKIAVTDAGYEKSESDGSVAIFDNSGRPQEKRDRYGNAIKYIYNDAGLVSAIEDVFGRRIEFVRRPDGLISKTRDFAGRAFTYTYNDKQELVGVTTPAVPEFPKGKTTAYRYEIKNNQHLITFVMDPNGRAYLKNRYDEKGRVIAQSYGEGPWMNVVYEGQRAWVTDAMGVTRLYESDANGRLSSLWRYDGNKYSILEYYSYDEDGEMISSCLPSGRCKIYEYEDGTVVQVEDRSADGKESRIRAVNRACRETMFFMCSPFDKLRANGMFSMSYPFVLSLSKHKWRVSRQALNKDARDETSKYNAAGQIISEADAEGGVTSYEYYAFCDPDGDGVKIQGCIDDGRGGGYLKKIAHGSDATLFEYDPIGNITATTAPDGTKTSYIVNALNQIVKEESPGMAVTRYYFDANDNLKKAVIGNITREFEYDVLDRKIKEKMQVGRDTFIETKYNYDADGNLVRLTYPEGNAAVYEYDSEGRPVCIARGAGAMNESRECVERNVDGDVVAYIDGEGHRTKYELNGFGEPAAIIDPLGSREKYARNEEGRIISKRNFDSKGQLLSEDRFEYDSNGVMSKIRRRLWRDDPSNSVWVENNIEDAPINKQDNDREKDTTGWKYAYDVPGNLTSVTDPKGVETILTYDDLGRPLSIVRDAKGLKITTRYEWNGNGSLAGLMDAEGRQTKYHYDSQDRLSQEISPDGTGKKYEYDRRGLVTSLTSGDGAVLRMDYDAAGRLMRRAAGVGALAHSQQFAYDGLGRLIEAVDEGSVADLADDSVSRFVYDSLSRPIAEESGGRWLMREYDAKGNVAVFVTPSGKSFFFSRDSNDQLSSILHGGKRLAAFDYDSSGSIVRQALGDNMYLEIERDRGGGETKRAYYKNSAEWLAGEESFFDFGDRVSRESGYAGIERVYERDALGRLLEAREVMSHDDEGWPGTRKWSYDYDAMGNMKNSGATYKYDAAGNMKGDGEREFRYDALGRLVEILRDGAPVIRYRYDAFDRRVVKIIGDEVKKAVWDGWRLVEELKNGDDYVDYIYGDTLSPVAAVSDSGVSYMLTDRLNSLIAEANADGTVTARCSYDPYGRRIPVMPPGVSPPVVDDEFVDCDAHKFPFGFAGEIQDAESGFIYMRERYYDPKYGRFLTPDPLGYKVSMEAPDVFQIAPAISYHAGQGAASRATYPNRPLAAAKHYGAYPFNRALVQRYPFAYGETNLYLYAKNDPSTFEDPLGLASLLFDRSEETITLMDGDGVVIESYDAANFTTRPNADPLIIGANGPFPSGTYSIGIPEFYSDEYRRYVVSKYELGDTSPWGAVTNGKAWVKNSADRKNYSIPFGRIRIRAGSYRGLKEDAIVASRGLFLHGGRMNYKSKTHGCIRVDDRDIEKLAVEFINFQRDGDPVDSITVRD